MPQNTTGTYIVIPDASVNNGFAFIRSQLADSIRTPFGSRRIQRCRPILWLSGFEAASISAFITLASMCSGVVETVVDVVYCLVTICHNIVL